MEIEILQALQALSNALYLPEPQDLRRQLARNVKAPKWKTRNLDAIKGMVWHQELGWGSVEAVAKYHTGKDSHIRKGGTESIAYTWAVRRNGQIALCNDLKKVPWSHGFKGYPGDANKDFVSVMFEGLFAGAHVTDASAGQPKDVQMLAGLVLWQVCKSRWEWNEDGLRGHFLLGKPSCPGSTFQSMIEAVRFNYKPPERRANMYDFGTVRGRQQALADLGYYKAKLDGVWGPGSKGALTKFQADAEISADGVWGNQTEAVIGKKLAELTRR